MNTTSLTASPNLQKLDPLKRVNYTFGLVLGVEEFVQSDTYFLAKHHVENRLLHGYGTICGLAVVVQATPAWEIQVTPGWAINPRGQEIRVPQLMCVQINDWLSANLAALKAALLTTAPPLSLRLCVVLCARECKTDTVPIPGEPCMTQSSAMAPSRIADSFELMLCLDDSSSPPASSPPGASSGGLRLSRPAQREDDAIRALAHLMSEFEVSATGPFLDVAQVEQLVLDLAQPAGSPPIGSPPPKGPPYLISAPDAAELRRAALRTWITRVRPFVCSAQGTEPCCPPPEKCVLLAELVVGLAGGATEWIATSAGVDDSLRPFLVPTRLMQEIQFTQIGGRAMSAVNLLTPILNGGIQNVNFVNGRVLAAEDLTAERSASLQRQRLLGNSVGDGVASGFEVTLSASSVAYGQQVVHVTAGVAVNRNGDVMQLIGDTDVTLAASLPSATVNGLFAPCAPPQTQLTNPGVYVLTVLPASGYQGQAPVTQLNSGGIATSCSGRYQTSGVQFRLSLVTLSSAGTGLQPTLYALANQIQTQLNTGATAATLAPQLSQLRNGLAHACFGTDTLATFATNPFAGLPGASSFDAYGLIDAQRAAGLVTDCEVPLALAYWSQQGVQFIDMWSVRRPVVSATASEDWPLFSGRRRWTEGLAMFLQFQDQAAGLLSTLGAAALGAVSAAGYFYYLPPVGFLPIANVNPAIGFQYLEFFNQRTYRNPVFVEGSKLGSLLQEGLRFPPIDLSKQEMLWVYQIRDNQQAIDNDKTTPPAAYMIFTNGQIGYAGDSKYDLNYFNYANFA